MWSLSLWVCSTRVTDHVHHLQDVIAGYVLGGAIGVVLAHQTVTSDCDVTPSICHNTEEPPPSTASCPEISGNNTNHVEECKDAEKGTV